jgi:hypothetical protein
MALEPCSTAARPPRTCAITVTSLEGERPDAATIAAAGAEEARPARDLNDGDDGALPADVAQLAQQSHRGPDATAGAKAQALEAYLRSDRFTYSTAPAVGVGRRAGRPSRTSCSGRGAATASSSPAR